MILSIRRIVLPWKNSTRIANVELASNRISNPPQRWEEGQRSIGGYPLKGEKGEFLGSLAGVQDISVLKNTQSKLTEQSRHFEELVKNARTT
jgi:hypothetical protein